MNSMRKRFCLSLTFLTAIIFYVFLFFNSKPNRYENPLYPKYRVISPKSHFSFNKTSDIETNPDLNDNNFGKNYRIDTKGCKIRDLPLFDAQTKRFFENKTETIWRCNQNIINIHRINGTAIHIDWSALDYRPFCYYRQLRRGKDDFENVYGDFRGPLSNQVLNLPGFEFVDIVCRRRRDDYKSNGLLKLIRLWNNKDLEVIHKEIIPLIPFVDRISDSSAPNVLLLAIDSTSYVNFKRHFIRTEKLLNKQTFFELRGYNKVGDNTFPNMMPFLTGHQSEELVTDEELQTMHFDDWPLIWRKYAEQGFVTAFVEEMPEYGLFEFNRKGFKFKPTDYYTRPFQKELEKDTNHQFCYKNKAEFEIVLDWTYDFINAMNERQQKYFAYISISEMTHDWLNAAHYMDVPFSQFFGKLFEQHLLNNTLVLFFSDHGLRTGEFRKTGSGEMENRLPFIFIKLPENTNKTHFENISQNQYRLTTPYDIHATLTRLLEGRANHSLPHGLSLIEHVISEDRDCDMAAIPEIFCACYEEIPIFDSKVIIPEQTVPKIINKINSFTQRYRSKCIEFRFRAIHAISKRVFPFKENIKEQDHNSSSFIVQMYATPGMALFETIIRGYNRDTGFEIMGEITRINRYGNQSHCVTEKKLKNYCFCNDLL